MEKKRGRPSGTPNSKKIVKKITKYKDIYAYLQELEAEKQIFCLSRIYPICEPKKYMSISFKIPIPELYEEK